MRKKNYLFLTVFISGLLCSLNLNAENSNHSITPFNEKKAEISSAGLRSNLVYLGSMTYDAGENRYLVVQAWSDIDTGMIGGGMKIFVNGMEGAVMHDGGISLAPDSVQFWDVTIHYFSGSGNGSFVVNGTFQLN